MTAGCGAVVACRPRGTEVGYLTDAFRRQQNRIRLYIPVDNTRSVCVRQNEPMAMKERFLYVGPISKKKTYFMWIL